MFHWLMVRTGWIITLGLAATAFMLLGAYVVLEPRIANALPGLTKVYPILYLTGAAALIIFSAVLAYFICSDQAAIISQEEPPAKHNNEPVEAA